MNNFAEKLTQKLSLNKTENINQFIDNFYIQKYGSYENVVLEFKKLKESSKNEEEFQRLLVNKFKNDLHLDFFELFLTPLLTVKSFTDLIKTLRNFKKIPKSQLVKYNLNEISKDFNNLLMPTFKKTHNINEVNKDEFVNIINDSFNFTLASVRKELSFPDPRTFNPWLKGFFGDKYNKQIERIGSSAGKLTLYEYIDIVSAFMLSCDEEKFDFSNIEELDNRFENEKVTQKKILKKLTRNNYALLKERLEDIKYLSENKGIKIGIVLRDEKKYRNIPYSVVSIIKKELKEY